MPYKTKWIPESDIKNNLEKALENSDLILSYLKSKNSTDNLINLYPKHFSDIKDAKKYIKFTYNLENISRNDAVINVKMAISFIVKGKLYRITYVPKYLPETYEFGSLIDQSVSYLLVLLNSDGYFLIKDIDSCKLVNDIFFCDPTIMKKVLNKDDSCITNLYNSDCKWTLHTDCSKTLEKCSFYRSSIHDEFTPISHNKLFALFGREANYIYKCDDGFEEKGKLVFGNNIFAGTVKVEENCSLITAYTSVLNINGKLGIEYVDNDEMLWEDIPKVFGIPLWIVAVFIGTLGFVVLVLFTLRMTHLT